MDGSPNSKADASSSLQKQQLQFTQSQQTQKFCERESGNYKLIVQKNSSENQKLMDDQTDQNVSSIGIQEIDDNNYQQQITDKKILNEVSQNQESQFNNIKSSRSSSNNSQIVGNITNNMNCANDSLPQNGKVVCNSQSISSNSNNQSQDIHISNHVFESKNHSSNCSRNDQQNQDLQKKLSASSDSGIQNAFDDQSKNQGLCIMAQSAILFDQNSMEGQEQNLNKLKQQNFQAENASMSSSSQQQFLQPDQQLNQYHRYHRNQFNYALNRRSHSQSREQDFEESASSSSFSKSSTKKVVGESTTGLFVNGNNNNLMNANTTSQNQNLNNNNSNSNSSNNNSDVNSKNIINNNFFVNVANVSTDQYTRSSSNTADKKKVIRQKMFDVSQLKFFVRQQSQNNSSKSSKNNSNMSSNDSHDKDSGPNSRVINDKKIKENKQASTTSTTRAQMLYGPTKEELNQKLMEPVGHRRTISSNLHQHSQACSSSGSSLSSTNNYPQNQKLSQIQNQNLFNSLGPVLKQESSTYSHFQTPVYSQKLLHFYNESSSSSSSADNQQSFIQQSKKKISQPFSQIGGDVNNNSCDQRDETIQFEKQFQDIIPNSKQTPEPSNHISLVQSSSVQNNKLPTVVTEVEDTEDDDITNAFQEWSVNISPQASNSVKKAPLSPDFLLANQDFSLKYPQTHHQQQILNLNDNFDDIQNEINHQNLQKQIQNLEESNEGDNFLNQLQKPNAQQQQQQQQQNQVSIVQHSHILDQRMEDNKYQPIQHGMFYDPQIHSLQQQQLQQQQQQENTENVLFYQDQSFRIQNIILQQQQQFQVKQPQNQQIQQNIVGLPLSQPDQQANIFFPASNTNEKFQPQFHTGSLILPPQQSEINNIISSPSVMNQSLQISTPPSNFSNQSKHIESKKQYQIGDLTPREGYNTLSTNPSSKKSVCMKSPKEDNFFTTSSASSTNKIISKNTNIHSTAVTDESLIDNLNQQYPTISNSELGMMQKNQYFTSQIPIAPQMNNQINMNPLVYTTQVYLSDEKMQYQQSILNNPSGQKMKTQPNPQTSSSSQYSSNSTSQYNFTPSNMGFKNQLENIHLIGTNIQSGLRSSECYPQSPSPNLDFLNQRKSLHVSSSTGSNYFSEQKQIIPQVLNFQITQHNQPLLQQTSSNQQSNSSEPNSLINQHQYGSGIHLKTSESTDFSNQSLPQFQNMSSSISSIQAQQQKNQQIYGVQNQNNQKSGLQKPEIISQASSSSNSSINSSQQQQSYQQKKISNQFQQQNNHDQFSQQFQLSNSKQQFIPKKNFNQINQTNFQNISVNSNNSSGSNQNNNITNHQNNNITINNSQQINYPNHHKRQQSQTSQSGQKQNPTQMQQNCFQKPQYQQQKMDSKQNTQQINQNNMRNSQQEIKSKPMNNISQQQQQIQQNQKISQKNNNNNINNNNNNNSTIKNNTINMNQNNHVSNLNSSNINSLNSNNPNNKQGGRHRHTVSESSTEYKIDLKRINEDGRTTLMIKNIPNKYEQDLLLQTIDRKHKHTYDFFYLPIDFTNNCNVGYAFINFKETRFIEPFYREFNDQKWKKYNSDKICQLCYARIQGSESLNNHFRSSSVMNQKDNKYKPLFIDNREKSAIQQIVDQQAENDLFQPYKNLVQILQNPSKTLKDAEAIYQQIENHPYIKKFFGENISDKSAALQLCKNMSVQFFKRGDIVMAQGDQSDNKLYVILEGKVGIVINFKGPKPPDGAIYDRDLQEKLEREQQESIQSQEDKIDEELQKRIISIFKKDKEDDKKKYVPFGEEPEMQKRVAINKQLNDLIENKNSILKPKDEHKFKISQSKQNKNRSSSIFKPPFKQLIYIIQQKKKEKQQQLEMANSHKPSLHIDLEGIQSRVLEKKNSFISPTDTPKARKLMTEQQESKEKKYQQQIESFGTKVNEIGKGTGFGDKALLAANPKQAVRNATIICTTPVLCIIVYRKDFLRVVENFSAEAILKEKTITRQFKFFKDVSSTSLKERLLYYFQDINLLKNEFVCKEGEYAEGLYIFAEGKVTLQKKYEDQKNIYYQKYQNISICTIERPTFFCEEVIFSKEEKPKCKYTIQVTSQKAHLYFCSKQNFLYKFPKDAIEELNQFYQARDLSYQQLFDHCKEVQFNNDQIKKQNEKAMNDNAHYMNFQQNKELFTQMKSACIDYQVKKVVPKLIDQFENQQHLVTQNNKIKLNDDFDPTVQDFCSRVDFVMKKNIEEREMVKKIIKQKKIKTDKRTFKQKQSSYKYGKQNSQQVSFEEDEIIQSGEESNQNAHKNLSVDSEEKIKLLRNIFSKGKKMNMNEIDLNLFYRNQEELYEDSDVNLLLDIRKPKKQQQSYNKQKSQENYDQTIDVVNNIQSIQYPNSPSNKGDSSPTKKNFELQKYDYSNFEADELKTPPPEINKTQSQLKTKLNQNELDIGYLEMFKKQQYFYMVRKGAIKINHNTEFPQLDLRKKILKKIKKRKSLITDGEKFSHSFCLSPQVKKQQFLNKCASYDIMQQDEILKINSSNYTDITSQMQNEENVLTDRSDPTIQLNKIFDSFQPNQDQRLKHHSVSEIKSPFMKQRNSKKSSFKDIIKSGDKDATEKIKNFYKGKISSNPIQITEDFKNLEGLQQLKSELEAKSNSQIQFNKLEFPNSQESIQCLDKGGFLSPKNNIGSMFYNKMSSDQPLLPYLNCNNEYSTPSSIQTKKQSEIFTNKNQSLTKQDIKLAQINQAFTPTGVGSRLNGLNSCVVQPKIVSAQNSQKKDHQFYLTTRSEEVSNNNVFFGNPNNFQITSFSYQLKQFQQQQQQQAQQQQQMNQSLSKKLTIADNSVSRANKYLKYKINQTNETQHLQSAPNLRKFYQQEQNQQQKEFFFKQNFKNGSQRNSQNLTQQLNQTGTQTTQTKNEKSAYPQTFRASQHNFKIDQSKNCEEMNSLQKHILQENDEIYQNQGEDLNQDLRTTSKKDMCLQTLSGNFPQNRQSHSGNSSDVSNYAQFNQTNGSFTFKNHLKKVFVTRQKIFKAENHLKPNLSYLQPLQNSKELKLSPHFFANNQQQPAK
ncbi:hypothetical protein ABPG74_010691 [Tetrahymena malaccensis]